MSDDDRERGPRVARLRPDPAEESDRLAFQDDIRRLVDALAADSIVATEKVAYAAWRRHSDDLAAGWAAPYSDDERLRRASLPHSIEED